MRGEKIQLFIDNSRELGKSGGVFSNNAFINCNALSLSVKGVRVEHNKINEAIEIIKNNTSLFSNFRGNNLFTVASCIYLEEDMESALKEIIKIYELLKNDFGSSQYLVLASIIIFNAKDRIDIDSAIMNTKKVYDSMKKNHKFLTSREDVSAASMIAVTSESLEYTLVEIEKCYKSLRDVGFFAGNNLQSLSHIIPLFNGTVEEKVKKVDKLNSCLNDKKIHSNGYSLPLLGFAAIIDNVEEFSSKVKSIDDDIKNEKGFGMFSLNSQVRNMISMGLAVSYYAEQLNEEEKQKIIHATNSINLTIQITIEIATTAAVCAAVAAASASN